MGRTRFKGMRWLGIVFGVSIFASFPGQVAAQDDEEIDNPPSSLLVLLAASDPDSVSVERQLVAELRLTLDGLQVEQIVIERGDFLELTLPEQLEVVQPLISRFSAEAAVWVTSGGSSGHLIQFVVSEQGSATVRTVEAGSAEDLALAVSELLEQTYLFDPKKTKKKKEVARIYAGVTVGLNGGVYGHEGASLVGGMGLQARFRLTERLHTGVQISGQVGPRMGFEDGLVVGRRIGIEWISGYFFRFGRVQFGPVIEISVLYSSLNAILGGADFFTDHWSSFRGALGAELGVNIVERMTVVFGGSLGGLAPQRVFRRASVAEVFLSTPIMDYSIHIGLLFGLL